MVHGHKTKLSAIVAACEIVNIRIDGAKTGYSAQMTVADLKKVDERFHGLVVEAVAEAIDNFKVRV
jgi:hypothetical protein